MRLIDAGDTKKNILDQVELAKSLIPIPEFIELAESLSEDWCKQIDMMPTVDAVKVVRCKDCKHSIEDKLFGSLWCQHPTEKHCERNADFYCGSGERRDDAEVHQG